MKQIYVTYLGLVLLVLEIMKGVQGGFNPAFTELAILSGREN